MMANLLMHLSLTRPQWVKANEFILSNACLVYRKCLVLQNDLDPYDDLKLCSLVLTRHPKSAETFIQRYDGKDFSGHIRQVPFYIDIYWNCWKQDVQKLRWFGCYGSFIWQNTVECRDNVVWFITILSTALWWQQQNKDQAYNSQQTPHRCLLWEYWRKLSVL